MSNFLCTFALAFVPAIYIKVSPVMLFVLQPNRECVKFSVVNFGIFKLLIYYILGLRYGVHK